MVKTRHALPRGARGAPQYNADCVPPPVSPLDSRIALLEGVVVSKKLWRQKPPHQSVNVTQLEDINVEPFHTVVREYCTGVHVSHDQILLELYSGLVLPILKLWLAECDACDMLPVIEAELSDLQHGDTKSWLPILKKMAELADKQGFAAKPKRKDGADGQITAIFARHAAMISNVSPLIHKIVQYGDDEAPSCLAHLLSCTMILSAYRDMQNAVQPSFCGVLLRSELADPMRQKVRAMWEAKYLLPDHASVTRVQSADHEDNADDQATEARQTVKPKMISVAVRKRTAVRNREPLHVKTGPLSDKEELVLLLAYRHSLAERENTAADVSDHATTEIDWEDIAAVLPGRTVKDCITYYLAHRSFFVTNLEYDLEVFNTPKRVRDASEDGSLYSESSAEQRKRPKIHAKPSTSKNRQPRQPGMISAATLCPSAAALAGSFGTTGRTVEPRVTRQGTTAFWSSPAPESPGELNPSPKEHVERSASVGAGEDSLFIPDEREMDTVGGASESQPGYAVGPQTATMVPSPRATAGASATVSGGSTITAWPARSGDGMTGNAGRLRMGEPPGVRTAQMLTSPAEMAEPSAYVLGGSGPVSVLTADERSAHKAEIAQLRDYYNKRMADKDLQIANDKAMIHFLRHNTASAEQVAIAKVAELKKVKTQARYDVLRLERRQEVLEYGIRARDDELRRLKGNTITHQQDLAMHAV